MTSKELIQVLEKLDPDGNMEVICTRCSDFCEVDPSDVTVIEAVKKPSACYIMRAHPTMSEADWKNAKRFIHFEGN